MPGVVEVPPEPEEPFVAGDADDAADEERAEATDWFVGAVGVGEAVRLDALGGEVAEEVDDEGGLELSDEGAAGLHVAVAAEGDFDGFDPGPVCSAEDVCVLALFICLWGRWGRRLRGFMASGLLAVSAEDVSLDGLLEAANAGPPSEDAEDHSWGSRDGIDAAVMGR